MTDINVGAITEALNNKVDLPTPSTPQDAVDYVVEKQDPTSANGYTWYRKYKSGWVEQGGLTQTEANSATITMPCEMQDDKYTIVACSYRANPGESGATEFGITVGNRTTTTFFIVLQNSRQYMWTVSGMSA